MVHLNGLTLHVAMALMKAVAVWGSLAMGTYQAQLFKHA
jgi:hypothetical protein